MKSWSLIVGISVVLSGAVFANQKPNILFIFSDDHAYQSIGAYNGILKDYTRTPLLDNLAAEGMLFTRAYVTNSICAPSRATVQTGKYSHKNGKRTNSDRWNGDQQTFPKIMQQNGYQTAVIGKWHLGSEPQGYDYYEATPGQGRYFQPQYRQNQNWRENKTYDGYNSDVIGDRTIHFLENFRDKNKPFMLMMQFKATHRSWMPPLRYLDQYKNDVIPEPASLFDDLDNYKYRSSATQGAKMSLGRSPLGHYLNEGYDDKRHFTHNVFNPMTKEQLDAYRAAYAEDNARFPSNGTQKQQRSWYYRRYITDILSTGKTIDDNVGRVLDYLKANGLDKNTVVIYTSDQGFYLGEHSWFDKRWMYEESLRTPLIVKWPGHVKPGVRNTTDIVSNLDFAQTFLDIAGIPQPADMQGASLVPVFEGWTPADWRKSFYYQYYEGGVHGAPNHYGVTTGRYKLIYFHEYDEWEFYDLDRDPQEMINQYHIPENKSIITDIKKELARLRTELEVPNDEKVGTRDPRKTLKWIEQLPIRSRLK